MDQPNTPEPSGAEQRHHPDAVTPAANGPAPAGTSARRNRDTDAPSAPVPPPPLTPVGWLTSNGPYLVIMLTVIILLYRNVGMEGMVQVLLAVLGLGFVIFIHELGHFLAAKWCDVHVTTFSIGFGPALPGCSFTRGETTYKIAILPLGGYVNMVGEGPEGEDDENYSRSFKNKTVGQRMLIISAGVIMNLIFGAIAFILVYRYHGEAREPVVVWRTDAGSRAWEAGVKPGWRLTKIDRKNDPWFDDMRVRVALSPAGRAIDFTFVDRQGKAHQRALEPHKDANNLIPVVGIAPPQQLTLVPEKYRRLYEVPVRPDSAAAAARVLALNPGDVILAVGTPGSEKFTELKPGPQGWLDLCQKMRDMPGEPLALKVRRAGARAEEVEQITLEARGFEFGDQILATTDPDNPDHPFHITPLPLDPTQDPKSQIADPFAFRKRMAVLAGKPAVVQVRREGASSGDPPVNILVPPAYQLTLGLRMKMGKVAAIRQESPAAQAGGADASRKLNVGDVITGASLSYDGGKPVPLDEAALDPVRLPHELARRIHADPKKDVARWKVILTVRGTMNHDAQKERTLAPMNWDDDWSSYGEVPLSSASPWSIPQLGIAYWIESQVVKVEPGSPAARAGIQANDLLVEVRFAEPNRGTDKVTWGRWEDLVSKRDRAEVHDQWAHVYWLMQSVPMVEFRIKRDGKVLPETTSLLTAVPDRTWPRMERGLILMMDRRIHKADSLGEAFWFGVDRTVNMCQRIYLNLSRLITGRISAKTLGGPVEIATQAYSFAGEDPFVFFLFLGMISINLAVVNFLPIPVLDGGHMVFLIYEKLRGRRPSETVQAMATYLGLAIILALMIFVFILDGQRRGWWKLL